MRNCKRFLALILCAALLLSNVIISTPSVSAATVDAYVNSCTAYPANLTVKTTMDTTMMSHPCSPATDGSSAATHIIAKDTVLNVTGLYRNTAGEYWYRVERFGATAYIKGDETVLVDHLTGDITAEDMLCPGSLYDGQTFPIGGTITSSVNKLGKITASMYWGVDLTIDPVITASDNATNNSYNLSSSAIDYNLNFGALDTGVYTYTVSAEAISYYVEDGQLCQSVKDVIVERHRCVITDYTNPNEITGWGVDVSVWNGYIDWSQARYDLDFAILRSSFEETTDNRFLEYASNCEKYGIPFGVYVYSYAENVAEAEAEARWAVNLVKNYDMMQLPIFFDAEDAVLAALSTSELQAVTKAFIDVVRESGYEAGIYTGISWFNSYYNTPYFHSVAKWLVQIDGFYGGYTNSYNGGVHYWQYNWEGDCSGISGDLDVNYSYDLLPGQSNDTTYRSECTTYPSHLRVKTSSSVTKMKYPCNSSTNSTSTSVSTVASGAELVVTALYKNTAGEYWYQVDGGYIPANKATVVEFLYDDVGMYNPDMADSLSVGASYAIRGWVSAQYNQLGEVNARVYSGEKVTGNAALSSSHEPWKNEYSLYNSKVDAGLVFGDLSAGNYTYEISADVQNYYVSNGTLTSKNENVVVYAKTFNVGSTSHSHTTASKAAVAATCTSNGISATTYCTECGRITSGGQVTPMLGHDYKTTTIPGDCQNHESQYKVCRNCGEETYTYADDMFSDWSTTKPNVADKLIQTKKQYRSASAQTTTSTSSSLAGYTLVGSTWDNGTSGTVVYAPEISNTGFSTSSSLYSQYNKSPKTPYENDTQKLVVNSDSQTGYLYYHWCYANSYYSVESSYGSYTTFHAYYDTTDPSNYTCDTSDMSYKTSHSGCSNSLWYFVTEVNTQTYTTYNKLYIHSKPGTWSAWGDTPITPSDSLMVEERTLYRYVDAPYGDHNYVNGVCTVCGNQDSSYSSVTLTGKSFSLSFEDEILVNFYFCAENLASSAELGMLVFHTNPGTADVSMADEQYPNPVYTAATGYYTSTTDGIAAKEMGDTRYYCAYAKLEDGTYVYSPLYEYSPKKYAMSRLANSTNTEMKALCVAMLNYGAEAQKYFNYKTNDLMNKDLTQDQKNLVVDYSPSLFQGALKPDSAKIANFAQTATGFSGRSASVSFEGAFAINYYFVPDSIPDGDIVMYYWTANDYNAADQLSVSNASGKITMEKQENGAYWAHLDGIAAKQLDDTYYVAAVYTSDLQRCCTGVISYSLSKYCMNNAAGTSAMKDLAAYTAVYGYHAKAYFATIN